MGSVCVQHERAGLLQVPVAALQQLLALGSGPQAQTEQLLHLQQTHRNADENTDYLKNKLLGLM